MAERNGPQGRGDWPPGLCSHRVQLSRTRAVPLGSKVGTSGEDSSPHGQAELVTMTHTFGSLGLGPLFKCMFKFAQVNDGWTFGDRQAPPGSPQVMSFQAPVLLHLLRKGVGCQAQRHERSDPPAATLMVLGVRGSRRGAGCSG